MGSGYSTEDPGRAQSGWDAGPSGEDGEEGCGLVDATDEEAAIDAALRRRDAQQKLYVQLKAKHVAAAAERSRAEWVETVVRLCSTSDAAVYDEEDVRLAARLVGVSVHLEDIIGLLPPPVEGKWLSGDIAAALCQLNPIAPSIPPRLLDKLRDHFRVLTNGPTGRVEVYDLENVFRRLRWAHWSVPEARRRLAPVVEEIKVESSRVKDDDDLDDGVKLTIHWHAVVHVVAGYFEQNLTPTRYFAPFALIDEDSSGSITRGEVMPVLLALNITTRGGPQRVLDNLFSQGRRRIDNVQFAITLTEQEMMKETWPPRLIMLAKAFSSVDVDGSGEIDLDEFITMLSKLGVKFKQKQGVAWYKTMDQNGDMTVTFKEFVNALAYEKLVGCDAFNADKLANLSALEIMSSPETLSQLRDIKSLPVLQRTAAKIAVNFTRRRGGQPGTLPTVTTPAPEADDLRIIDQVTAKKIKKAMKRSVIRCALYGALSALIGWICEEVAIKLYPTDDGSDPSLIPSSSTDWKRAAVTYCPALFATFVETFALYYDQLVTGVQMSQVIGVKLWPPPNPEALILLHAIVNEALELGHSSEPLYNVDPLMEANGCIIFLYNILYKLRAGMAKFLLKTVLKRVLVRSALKGLNSVVAIPILALMNAVLSYKILCSLRVLVNGSACIYKLIDHVFCQCIETKRKHGTATLLLSAKTVQPSTLEAEGVGEAPALPPADAPVANGDVVVDIVKAPPSQALLAARTMGMNSQMLLEAKNFTPLTKEIIMRAVATSVVKAQCWHPNLMLIFNHVQMRLDVDVETIDQMGDPESLSRCLPMVVKPADAEMVLRLISLCVMCDGEVGVGEKIYIKQTLKSIGMIASTKPFMHAARQYKQLKLQKEHVSEMFREYKWSAKRTRKNGAAEEKDDDDDDDKVTITERFLNVLGMIAAALAL